MNLLCEVYIHFWPLKNVSPENLVFCTQEVFHAKPRSAFYFINRRGNTIVIIEDREHNTLLLLIVSILTRAVRG